MVSTPHLVNIVLINNSIKQRVEIVEKIYNLHRCTARRQVRKSDDIGEIYRSLIIHFWVDTFTNFQFFCNRPNVCNELLVVFIKVTIHQSCFYGKRTLKLLVLVRQVNTNKEMIMVGSGGVCCHYAWAHALTGNPNPDAVGLVIGRIVPTWVYCKTTTDRA